MNIVDILIIIVLILGAALGFARGFTKQLVTLVGIILILVLSFILKNPISVFFYNNFPFFNFGGIFKDITVLNILLYEIIAFFIVFSILTIIFKMILTITTIFEKILTMTIIFGIPSKILGAILGVVQYFIFVFIFMYVLSLPMFNIKIVKESSIGNTILNHTPILTNVCDKTLNVFNEIVELKDEYENTDNVNAFNQKALDIMIENKVITKENAIKLIDKGKIKGVMVN